MFNFRRFFRIGIYDIDDDFLINYSDGSGGINVHMQLVYEVNSRYTINTYFNAISSGDVENNGIIFLNMTYYRNSEPHFPSVLSFDPFTETYSKNINIELGKDINFSCSGFSELQIVSEGIPQNEDIDFQLTFFIPLSRSDFIQIDLNIYALFFLYFFLYLIIPIILLIIFKPSLGLKYREEDMKKDEQFLGYIQKQANNKREAGENKKNNINS
jgi:hypothetical protein